MDVAASTRTRWEPLALSAAVGAVTMVVAVVPLFFMTGLPQAPSAVPRALRRSIARAASIRLTPACCFSIFGFRSPMESPPRRGRFQISVLNIPYTTRQLLQGMMRAGQSVLAPVAGRLVDCFWQSADHDCFATDRVDRTYLFSDCDTRNALVDRGRIFVVWSAYAGLNVGLDNIKLKLAPPGRTMRRSWQSITPTGDLANGIATIVGGLIYDRLVADKTHATSFYTQIFMVGLIARDCSPCRYWRG